MLSPSDAAKILNRLYKNITNPQYRWLRKIIGKDLKFIRRILVAETLWPCFLGDPSLESVSSFNPLLGSVSLNKNCRTLSHKRKCLQNPDEKVKTPTSTNRRHDNSLEFQDRDWAKLPGHSYVDIGPKTKSMQIGSPQGWCSHAQWAHVYAITGKHPRIVSLLCNKHFPTPHY